MVLASVYGSLGIAGIAQQVRRLLAPMGGSGRQDLFYAAGDAEKSKSASDVEDFEAWEAYCKDQKKLGKEERGSGKARKSAAAKGGGGKLDSVNHQTRTRSR